MYVKTKVLPTDLFSLLSSGAKEQSAEDSVALLSKMQTKEPTEEVPSAEDIPDTPSSDLSTLTSSNGSSQNTETNVGHTAEWWVNGSVATVEVEESFMHVGLW